MIRICVLFSMLNLVADEINALKMCCLGSDDRLIGWTPAASCLMKTCPDLSLDQNKPCRVSFMCAFILKNMNLMTLS